MKNNKSAIRIPISSDPKPIENIPVSTIIKPVRHDVLPVRSVAIDLKATKVKAAVIHKLSEGLRHGFLLGVVGSPSRIIR